MEAFLETILGMNLETVGKILVQMLQKKISCSMRGVPRITSRFSSGLA